jgi:Aminomethyltransferase folate-binding domain
MQAALLPDRGVVKVVGDDARRFHNGLVTNDVAKVAPGKPAFAALLTPQGKIIVDFIIAEALPEDGGGFFLDCPRALAPDLVEKLNFYKLRAKVICKDLSDVLGVMAIWDTGGESEYGLCYPDPRLPALGMRVMLPPHLAAEAAADLGATLVDAESYDVYRIALGVPRGAPTSSMAIRFPTKPTWISSTVSISTKAATSDRRWSPVSSIGPARAAALCRSHMMNLHPYREYPSWQGESRSALSARPRRVGGSRSCVSIASRTRSPAALRSKREEFPFAR